MARLFAMNPTVEENILANTSSYISSRPAQSKTRPLPSTVPNETMYVNALAEVNNPTEVILSLEAKVSSLQEDLRLDHIAMDNMMAHLNSTQERLELEERFSKAKDLDIREWQKKAETLEKLLDAASKPLTMAENHLSMRESTEIEELKDRIEKLEASLKAQVSANEHLLETERTWHTQLHDQNRDHRLQLDQLEAKAVEQEARRKEAEARVTELQGSQTTLERQLAALQQTSAHAPLRDSNAHDIEELRRLVDFYKANSEKASRQAQEAFAMRSSGVRYLEADAIL
ncbi:hypothetical protein M434DRAFT_394163 [Hypoxylon sp. CO27-5]|nr:hypothetical protein M434DRAFT_394163 [Hypoxylon sp. CO27-5]